jgi:hypothetical protein
MDGQAIDLKAVSPSVVSQGGNPCTVAAVHPVPGLASALCSDYSNQQEVLITPLSSLLLWLHHALWVLSLFSLHKTSLGGQE